MIRTEMANGTPPAASARLSNDAVAPRAVLSAGGPDRQRRTRLGTAVAWVRALESFASGPPLVPALPPGRVTNLVGRGEMFFRHIQVPGVDVATGAAPVVLLHGWTLSADLNWFTGGFEVASRYGPVVAPDVRGHGRGLRSQEDFSLEVAADDVAALLEHLDLPPAVLVGYSMGGSIAQLCAHRHPERVAGVVLAATALSWRRSWRDRALWLALGGAEWALRMGVPEGLAKPYLKWSASQSPALEPFVSWIAAEARRGDPVDLGRAAAALGTFDATESARSARARGLPSAVIVTQRDWVIPAERQRLLAQAMGSEIVNFDAHHNGCFVAPEAWATALDTALNAVFARIGAQAVPGGDSHRRGDGLRGHSYLCPRTLSASGPDAALFPP
ncbi:MAG: alpha/beta fold hydrolase [Acidimicrobiales bacterium]